MRANTRSWAWRPSAKPRYLDEVYKLLRVAADRKFTLDMDAFAFHRSTEHRA